MIDHVFEVSREPRKMAAYKGHVYFPTGREIAVFDARAGSLKQVGTIPVHVRGLVDSKLVVDNNWLVLSDLDAVYAYHLADSPVPKAPAAVIGRPIVSSFDLDGERLVIAGLDDLAVFDVSAWPSPRLITTLKLEVDGPVAPVLMAGDFVWFGRNGSNARRFDLRDLEDIRSVPAKVLESGVSAFRSGNSVWQLTEEETTRFRIDGKAGMLRSDDSEKDLVPEIKKPMAVLLAEDVAFAFQKNGKVAFGRLDRAQSNSDCGDIEELNAFSCQMAERDGVVYFSDTIMDVRNPLRPRSYSYQTNRMAAFLGERPAAGGYEVGQLPIGDATAIFGNRLVAGGHEELIVYDLKNPLFPREVGRIKTEGEVGAVAIWEDNLYVGLRTAQVLRYRLGNQPQLLEQRALTEGEELTTKPYLEDLKTDGRHLVAGLSSEGLAGLRLNEDGSFGESYRLPAHWSNRVILREGLVFSGGSKNGVGVYDLFTDVPRELVSVPSLHWCRDFAVGDGVIVTAEDRAGTGVMRYDLAGLLAKRDLQRERDAQAKPSLAWIETLSPKQIRRNRSGRVEILRFEDEVLTTRTIARLASLPDLRHVEFNGTTISKERFAEFDKLKQLQSLKFTNVAFKGIDLSTLSKLPELEALIVAKGNFSDEQLASLGDLPKLTNLDLTHSTITDSGMAGLSRMASLRRLSLQTNKVISHKGLENLMPLAPTLQHLDLSWTTIDDRCAPTLSKFSNLHSLNLTGTKIGDEAVVAMSNLRRLQTLRLLHTAVSPDGFLTTRLSERLQDVTVPKLNDVALLQIASLPRLYTLSSHGTPVDDLVVETLLERRRSLLASEQLVRSNRDYASFVSNRIRELGGDGELRSPFSLFQVRFQDGDLPQHTIARLRNAGIMVRLSETREQRLRNLLEPKQPEVPKPEGQIIYKGAIYDVQWEVYDTGILRFIKRTTPPQVIDLSKAFWLNDVSVTAATVAGNHLWLGTNHGILRYELEGSSGTRMAINAKEVDVPINAIEFQNGIVNVTYAGEKKARFDVAAERWLVESAEEKAIAVAAPAAIPEREKGARLFWLLPGLALILAISIGATVITLRRRSA
jgi:hypothetical protein